MAEEQGFDPEAQKQVQRAADSAKEAVAKVRDSLRPIIADLEKAFERIGRQLKDDIQSAVGSGGAVDDTGVSTSSAGTRVITRVAGGAAARAATRYAGTEAATGAGAAAAGGGARIGATRIVGTAGAGAAAGALITATNMAIDASNARFARGREGVLAADRMSVLYQQMTGLGQLDVSSQYRMPLTRYRLGAGGINALMGLEAETGLSALGQASSVEAMRTLSGYQYSASDVTSMMASLANPATVNRMFMMTGTSIIGPGGTQRSMTDVMQRIVRTAGLTDRKTLESAKLPGSVTRSRLRMMGVPEDQISDYIRYAEANLTYQEKGGTGMYDPSKKQHRRVVGIEENFATQVEETQRLETARDEQFYRRQVDNYAYLERQTQSLTRAFGALEDRLSGILGLLGSNRIATQVFQSATGAGGDPSHRGDGATNDAKTTVPTWGNRRTLNEVKNMSSFKNLHPQMQDRLLRMMRDNPNVGFGEGVRDQATQRNMFLQRYRKTDSATNAKGQKNIFWEGSYWEHVSGAAAAPPGRSMHEIGLAADLTGDLDWVVKNASKYGLRSFHDVNNEPWHVQPSELPGSRLKYEESGAPWGRGPAGAAPFEPDSNFGETLDHPTTSSAQDDGTTFGAGELYGLTISQAVASNISAPAGGKVDSGNSVVSINRRTSSPGRGRLTGEQVAMLLYQMGFRGEDIAKGVAISKRESRWNSEAHNPNRSTGDNSYGLFQINMIEKYADGRRKWFGLNSNEELFDPLTNVRATKMMYDAKKGGGKNGWYDWGPYKGKSETYNTNMSEATQIVQSLKLGGDPMGTSQVSGSSSAGASMTVSGGNTFNISPNITMAGSGSSQDLQRVAKEVAELIRRELELQALRSS